MENKKYYGWKGFFPLLTFLAIYLGSGLICAALGYGGDSFKQVPRMAALVGALLVCMCMGGKERSLEYRMDTFCKGMSNQGTMIMIMVFLLAGAFSGVAKAMGGVQATANLGLSLVPTQFMFAGLFLISAFMATAMGTSMGTISAVGPIAVAVAESAGLNLALAISTVLGGAMFGDNLSMISDTTIAATRGCGCEMRDKFKMNGVIAAVAAVLAMVIYTVVGSAAELTGDFSYEFIKVIPYIFILVFALTGCNVFILLLAGIGVAGAIGFATGSFDIPGFAQAMGSGMSGMYDICLIALLLRGVGGVAEELGAIDWLVKKMHASGAKAYLVNTGWAGGSAASGAKRMKLSYTRAMVTAALNGSLDSVEFKHHDVFNMDYPVSCPNVPDEMLDARGMWADKAAYDEQANKLAEMFENNFTSKYPNMPAEIVNAGPKPKK